MNTFKKHFPGIMAGALGEVLLRAAAVIPLYMILRGAPFFGWKQGAAAWAGVFLAAFVFLCLPFRLKGYMGLRALCGGDDADIGYGVCLKDGIMRFARGILWGIPFLAGTVYLVWGYHTLDMPSFYALFKTLGGYVGGKADAGVMLMLALLAVLGIIFAWGWWLDMPSDFLSHRGRPFARSGSIRRKNGSALRKNAVIQALLLLPSAVLFLAVLAWHLAKEITWGAGAFAALQSILEQLGKPFSTRELLLLAAILLIVHLPLCALRKTRDAELVCRLEARE